MVKPPGMPDLVDLMILDALQDNFPLVARPYAEIASRLGLTETGLLERVKHLHEAGIIRGISPILESRNIGLPAATLIAFHVPEETIPGTADIINSYPEVSHNFQREHYYNLWFTLCAKNNEQIEHLLADILKRTGIPRDNVLNLPTVKQHKIDVRFSFFRPGEKGDTFGPP